MIRKIKIYFWLLNNLHNILDYAWKASNGYYARKVDEDEFIFREGRKVFKDFPK